jgi:uncharacterized protein (DUF2062 family)
VTWARIARQFPIPPLEGVATETIALIVALGLVFGTFPMYGCSTLLCGAAAILLRLNWPALQLVNYLISPLQLALLVPFNRVGARLFPAQAAGPAIFHSGFWQLVSNLGTAAMHAIVGWFCVSAPLGILLYLTLHHIIRRRRRREGSMERVEPPAE